MNKYMKAFGGGSCHKDACLKPRFQYFLFIYLFLFLLTINLKLILVHVEIKIVNKEAATKQCTLLVTMSKRCDVNKKWKAKRR